MTWVGYFEDIEENQIESLKRDDRHLQNVAVNATLNKDASERYLEYAKTYHKAAKTYLNRVLKIVTHPDYSNVLLVPTIKRLEKELSDSNRVILALREELHKSGQEKDKLRSKLQNRVQENIQLVSQIENLERDLTIYRKEADQLKRSVNNHPSSCGGETYSC